MLSLDAGHIRRGPPPTSGFRFALLSITLVLIGTVLETRVCAGAGVYSVVPHLGLFVAVAAGLLRGPETGALLGLFGGYLLTTRVPMSPGSHLLSQLIPGYLSGLPRSYLYTENPLVPALAGMAAGIASETLFFLLTPRDLDLWLQSAAFQSLYGLVAVPVICALLRRTMRPESVY